MNESELMTRTTIRMPLKQYIKLKNLVKTTDKSIGFHIREAITLYLEKNKSISA